MCPHIRKFCNLLGVGKCGVCVCSGGVNGECGSSSSFAILNTWKESDYWVLIMRVPKCIWHMLKTINKHELHLRHEVLWCLVRGRVPKVYITNHQSIVYINQKKNIDIQAITHWNTQMVYRTFQSYTSFSLWEYHTFPQMEHDTSMTPTNQFYHFVGLCYSSQNFRHKQFFRKQLATIIKTKFDKTLTRSIRNSKLHLQQDDDLQMKRPNININT